MFSALHRRTIAAHLGHVPAELSPRRGHLFDTTVRAEYERAFDLAKHSMGALPTSTPSAAEPTTTWLCGPTIKTALAGGDCLRAPAQAACPYANICEYCPSYRMHATALHPIGSR